MNNELARRDNTESPAGAMMALIERAATSQDVDIDKLDRLLATKERWEAGEAKKAFDAAMTQFRSSVNPIRKTRQAHTSSYAGLAETLSEIKDNLSGCGLSVSWRTEQAENAIRVTCVVSHVAGHSEQTALAAAPDTSGSKNSIQAIGSTVTYLERYTLFAILGLASTDQDDDGNAAGRQVAYITEQQVADLESLIAELGDKLDRRAFDNWLIKSQKVPCADLDKIPATIYKDVVRILERKRAS